MPPAVVSPESQGDSEYVAIPATTTRRSLLAWSMATTGLLLSSGALRVALSRTMSLGDLQALAPFPLETIPETLNGWKVVPNGETHLDSVTTRITGLTSHIIRTYYDEMTGTPLSALIGYGPAEPVLPHTPQVCYPANGYRSSRGSIDRPIRIDDTLTATFRSALFSKSGGRSVIRQSVYHSYRLDGVWSPDVNERRLPRRQAGLFKVQVYRPILNGERGDIDEPIESFLQQLVPTLERMIAASVSSASAPTSPLRP